MNGTIKLTSGADNSILTNLHIQNSQDRGIGFLLIGVNNVEISNNNLQMNGYGAYGIGATHSNYLKITNNIIRETPTSEGTSHVSILLGDCHYNIISDNDIEVTIKKPYTFYVNLNGIYLSTYGSGVIDGGACNYNNITNNRIKGEDTVWCYTIQMMGNNNLAQGNTVFGGSIGISSVGSNNKIIDNNIQATETGIAAGESNTITGNTIELTDGAIGITSYANNGIIQNNKITTTNKPGMTIQGSNNIIKSNTIETTTGYGIWLKGSPKNNNIAANTINTATTGIMFTKESKKNYPVSNTIKNNEIKTTAEYTVDAYDSDSTIFSNNDLISAKGSGDITIRPSSSNSGGSVTPISGKNYTLDDTSYSKYFNEDGSLKHDVVGLKDTFKLTGPIYNKNMVIDIPITITGSKDAIIYNGTITVLCDGSETTITNVKIINDNQIGIIAYETDLLVIENNIITVNQIDESYGIYLHSSDNNIIRGNTIYSYGDYVNFGIFLYASDKNKVLKNHVNTISNDKPIGYKTDVMLNDKIGQIPEIFTTYGIIAVYSSNNQINENIVNLTSLFKTPQEVTESCSNSMVGIDIYYRSNGNTVNNNQVTVIGNNPYSYGMGVLGSEGNSGGIATETAERNSFENNIIKVQGNYFATGYIAGLGSLNTIIKNNTITATSNTFTYGITLEASQQSTIISNNISLSSPACYGMELFSSNKNTINNNKITVEGYYKYGIAGYSSSKNEINNNIIETKNKGSNPSITRAQHSDVIGLGNTGILLIKNSANNLIKSNEITSATDYTINITNSKNNTVTQNLVRNKDNLGTNSIFTNDNNNIYDNGAYKLSLETDSKDLTSKAGQKIKLNATVSSTSGNTNGATVTFQVGLTTAGTSPVQDGTAEITYKIPNDWTKGYYPIIITASKEDHVSTSITLNGMYGGLEIIKPDTYYLTDTNYSTYFNTDGTLKEEIGANDVFNLNEPLYNRNLKINMPIVINGTQNAILYNSTITIIKNGSGTTISNVKIINKNQTGIILNNTESNTLKNNELIVNQSLESYGIYLLESSKNQITNNIIYSYGDFVNFGIFLYASDDNKLQKNHINTVATDKEIEYLEKIELKDIGELNQIYTTYGILAVTSSNNQFNENIINLTSKLKKEYNDTCRNTMSGLTIYLDSHKNIVTNNKISVIGNNPWSYGIQLVGDYCDSLGIATKTAKENRFENNIIDVSANYFATGLEVGLGSIDTIIKSNKINTKSNTNTNGIELFTSNKTTITNNEITASGYYKYGIYGDATFNNEITSNNIITNNIDTIQTNTNILSGNAGIILFENSAFNLIKLNSIRTYDEYTINLNDAENNIVTENSLISNDKLGDKSVIAKSNNQVYYNEGYTLSINSEDINSNPGKTITLKATVTSTSGNSDGVLVTFKLGSTIIGTSTVKNGIAELSYTIPSSLNSGNYDITTIASGEDYLNKTVTKTLSLIKEDIPQQETPTTTFTNPTTPTTQPTKTNTKVTITPTKTTTTISKKAKKLVLQSKLKLGKKLGKSKTVTYIINGKKYNVKTNKNGVAKLTLKKSALKNILNKTKTGQKIKYQIKYGKTKITKYIKVKK